MNKHILLLWVVLLSLFFASDGKAKAILLDDEAGLYNAEITAITKDRSGLMWVATKRGLNKYDGYRFAEIAQLKNVQINAIVYDSARDVVWVGTEFGLYYIHCRTGDVYQCTKTGKQNPVTCLRSLDNKIIVGFKQKYVIQIDENLSCRVVYSFHNANLHPNYMAVNQKGDLYLYIGFEIVELSKQSGWRKARMIVPPKKYIGFIETFNNELYAGSVNAGIWNVNGLNHKDWFIDSLRMGGGDAECMLVSGNRLFVAYRNDSRIIEVHTTKRTVTNITLNDSDVFSYKRINGMFRDEFDILWVATSKGLIKMTPDKPKPAFERLLWNRPNPVSTRQIIGNQKGDLFVGSYDGFYHYHHQSQRWKNTNAIHFKGKPQRFTQRSLVNAGDQYIYIGSDANYFARYNPNTEIVEPLLLSSVDGKCNTEGASLAIDQDERGMIWIGSERGMLSFNPVTSELQCHTKDKFSVNESFVRCIYMLPGKRQFWVGTENGIYLLDIDKGTQKHFDTHTNPAIGGNLINAITVDHKGAVWVGTNDAGISVLSADYQQVYTIKKEDGLSSNEVYNMVWQDSVRLWVSTYKGLNYYQTQTQSVIRYFKEDGITDNEFNQNSAYKAHDGKMYFGGINGITAFYPAVLDGQERPFKVFVSGISKWEKTLDKIVSIPVDEQQDIVIHPGDNLLTFLFAVNDFTHSELHTYYYKIEGEHTDWIPLGSQPTLRLESLKGGEYNLLVRAVKGSRGQVSENTLVYHLSVRVEFYRTIWFYLLLLSGLVLLIFGYYSYRLNSQKKLEILRVKIASNLHDEVGSLLTRITMSADRLVTRMPRDSETRDKLEGVSALSREANVAMSDVLWTIDARNDFTGSLTDRMREHAEDLLLPRGIDVLIDFTEIDHSKKLSPEFRQHLFLLYKEIINNIIKHSRAEKVDILYKQINDHFVLYVKNDGVAEENKEAVSTGQGLRNIKMRAELIHGTVEIRRNGRIFEVIVKI